MLRSRLITKIAAMGLATAVSANGGIAMANGLILGSFNRAIS